MQNQSPCAPNFFPAVCSLLQQFLFFQLLAEPVGEGGGARFVQVGGVVALVADGLEHGGGWAFEPSEAGVEDGLLDFIEIAAAEAIFKVVHFGARHHAERDHVDLLLPAPAEVIHEGCKVQGRKGMTGKIVFDMNRTWIDDMFFRIVFTSWLFFIRKRPVHHPELTW